MDDPQVVSDETGEKAESTQESPDSTLPISTDAPEPEVTPTPVENTENGAQEEVPAEENAAIEEMQVENVEEPAMVVPDELIEESSTVETPTTEVVDEQAPEETLQVVEGEIQEQEPELAETQLVNSAPKPKPKVPTFGLIIREKYVKFIFIYICVYFNFFGYFTMKKSCH